MKVLKFGAVWCLGCIIMKKTWRNIEKQNPWLDTEYYDYDKDKEVVERYDLGKVLPVFIFLDKDKKELVRLIGEQKEKDLLKLIERLKDK